MKRFTEHEMEILRANPNVKFVRENRLDLTFAFRVQVYEQWEKAPSIKTIQAALETAGISRNLVGRPFIDKLHKTFRRHGRPSRGRRGFRAQHTTSQQTDEILLASGKFVRYGNSIRFSDEFARELALNYPERSVEDGIRDAGIDPQLVGYQRIYQMERRLKGEGRAKIKSPEEQRDYTEEEVAVIALHPYTKRVSKKRLQFDPELYQESSVLADNGVSMKRILEVYEIPVQWMTVSGLTRMKRRIRYSSSCQTGQMEKKLDQWTADRRDTFLRIRYHRMKELEQIAADNWKKVNEAFPGLNTCGKKRICEWIRDEVPREEQGIHSLSGILKASGITRSLYYRAVGQETYTAYRVMKEQQDREDGKLIRKVVEYGGYPKGTRQVYMQMEMRTGKHMGLSKIRRLMKEMDLLSAVRRPHPERNGIRELTRRNVKPNLLKRRFRLHRPGEVTLTDVTYMKHGDNWLSYGSAAIDSVSGKVLAFHVSSFNDLDLVEGMVRALPAEAVSEGIRRMFHSDQGALYLTDHFKALIRELGYQQSMSKRGNCWDNAPQESFWGHFKDECRYRDAQSTEELQALVQSYIQYYNEGRGQWTRNRMTPAAFERYVNEMSEEAFRTWQTAEEQKYQTMKQKAQEKAIQRFKSLGPE